MKEKIFICSCSSLEHQIMFWQWKDENYNELYINIHLCAHENFFKRLWAGIRYIFGHRSRFGEWDEFIFRQEDLQELKEFLNNNFNYEETETKRKTK